MAYILINVAAILRGRNEGLALSIILPALVRSTSVFLVRHTDHLTSRDWTSGQRGKFYRTTRVYDMKHKN